MEDSLSKICDCHVHFGQFRLCYYSAEMVRKQLEHIGIHRACVMPTGFFSRKEFGECLEAVKTFPEDKYDSFLWLSPRILRWLSVEKLFKLHNFKAIKIHYIAHPDWTYNQEKLDQVAEFAREAEVPIMFHTGDFFFCEPKVFEPICQRYPKTTFIFAHSRPVEQTIEAMLKYENIWADTAFTPIEDVKQMTDNDLADRILWGTDFPMFAGDEDTETVYRQRVSDFRSILSQKDFEKITRYNYNKLFKTK